MLLAGEVKGELARIQPARACDRRAELIGLLHGSANGVLRTLDHAIARTAVHLASGLDMPVEPPRPVAAERGRATGRRHLVVELDRAALGAWSWDEAPSCDRRAFLRGVLLGSGSISFTASGPHVEIVLADASAAIELQEALATLDVRALRVERRGRHVVYLKGQEEIAALLRLVGANRGVLELETYRVGRDVQARLNRLINAEEANLARTVRAADRQLSAIARLEAEGGMGRLSPGLREMAVMRRPVIAGNWKMNPPSLDEALALAAAVEVAAVAAPDVTTVICPPTIWLAEVARVATGAVALGAQTMHFEERGAFTGETSPLMLAGLASFVILGHSERRQYDGETDEAVGRKVASAVAHGLRPIAAVGERADERRAGETGAVIDRQVRAALAGLGRIGGSGLVVAYEPVWAIGTGDAASPADAQAVASQIRTILRELEADGADEVPIQYGGSVTDANALEFFRQPDIDGALVGGASLKPETFAAILRAGQAATGGDAA